MNDHQGVMLSIAELVDLKSYIKASTQTQSIIDSQIVQIEKIIKELEDDMSLHDRDIVKIFERLGVLNKKAESVQLWLAGISTIIIGETIVFLVQKIKL